MNENINYSKDIKFKTRLCEVTSISLEHELNKNNNELKGDFIVSGDYKTHELSINKEKFYYRLPFFVELTDNIDINSIGFDIKDFTYDVVNNDTLRIDIEFNVIAKSIEDKIKEKEEILFEKVDVIEDRRDQVELINNDFVDNLKNNDEEFVTYHVHIITESDTIDSICLKYSIDLDTLKKLNNIDNINVGDKLIIKNE